MQVFAETPVESTVLPGPAKVDTPFAPYWSALWGILVCSLEMLGLCRLSLILWPTHPLIAFLLCAAVIGLIGYKAENNTVRGTEKPPKLAVFLFYSLAYSLGVIIMKSQLDHSFDKSDTILWLLVGQAFAYLMMRSNRAPFDSIPTLRT